MLTSLIGDSVVTSKLPYRPMLSLMLPLKRFTYPFLTLSVSPSFILSMLSSQRLRYTQPVSSPTNASTILCGVKSRVLVVFRTSPLETTLTVTFTALESGVSSPTLTVTACGLGLSIMSSLIVLCSVLVILHAWLT